MSQPQTKKQVEVDLQGAMQELSLSQFDMSKDPISKEDTLKYIRIVEEKKCQSMGALLAQVKAGKLQQQQM